MTTVARAVSVFFIVMFSLLAWVVPGLSEGGKYADAETCVMCHGDVMESDQKTLHGAIQARSASKTSKGRNCQNCHGPSEAHAEDPTEVKVAWSPESLGKNASSRMCLTCHGNQISALKWRRGDHQGGKVQCWDCHSKERPAKAHGGFEASPDSEVCVECHHEVEGLFRLNSHHPVLVEHEQRIECADCHDAHGKIRQREVTDICRSCHTAKQGPFRFTHGAISSRMMGSCVECHDPHGSPNAHLLKFNNRGLCLQCHGDRVTHFPGPKCWSCHKAIHGSNSSPLLLTH